MTAWAREKRNKRQTTGFVNKNSDPASRAREIYIRLHFCRCRLDNDFGLMAFMLIKGKTRLEFFFSLYYLNINTVDATLKLGTHLSDDKRRTLTGKIIIKTRHSLLMMMTVIAKRSSRLCNTPKDVGLKW